MSILLMLSGRRLLMLWRTGIMDQCQRYKVRVFDDRIEIWSPGMLPDDLTIEDLKKEHRSVPRNPLLFKQLFLVKYVEDVGGGTLDMIKQCDDWGIPAPLFDHITGAFVVTFRLPPVLDDLEKLGLNPRQIKAMDHVVKKGSITNREYTSLNDISRKTATVDPVSYTHLRAHETRHDLVCRL